MITYKDLKSGYILEQGDFIELAENSYEVSRSDKGYYLKCLSDPFLNDHIFHILGINSDEKYAWAMKYEKGADHGIFPYFTNLTNLSNFVISIMERVNPDLKQPISDSKNESIIILPKHKTVLKIKL